MLYAISTPYLCLMLACPQEAICQEHFFETFEHCFGVSGRNI
jgi:hypothetical protein